MKSQPLTILVVDDDPDNRELLEFSLGAEGFGTESADSGDSALRSIDRRMPDLVLLDVMMPLMDGFTVLEKLKTREATRHIPVVMVTCLSDPQTKRRALEGGAAGLLYKPLNRSELAARIKMYFYQALRQRRDEAETN